jgi:ATP-dependent Lon protease
LKEKSLAALRAGINHIVIPRDNEKDLEDIPREARKSLQFYPVGAIDEVLRLALEPEGK